MFKMIALILMMFSVESNATVIPAKKLPDFSLSVSTVGNSFSNQNLKNHWTVLFFGFTHCPGICPATMRVMQQVYENLQKNKKELPQVVLISVDPKRDTAKQLKQYVQSFNPNFIGATGKEKELQILTKELGVLYTGHGDQIDHSASIFVMNPKGEYQALFSAPHEADEIAKELSEAYQ